MAASYPSAAKTFTTKATNDTIQASHVNDLQDEVTALESALLTALQHDLKFTDATYDIGKSGATRPRDFFLSRNATLGGTLTVSGTGAHSFSGAAAISNVISLRNTTDGADNFAGFALGNDSSPTAGHLRVNASGYTTSGALIADSISLASNQAGGLVLDASHASGNIKMFSEGGTTPTQTIDGAVVVANKAVAESAVITPTQITADQDDYAPTGGLTSAVWLLSSDISRPIGGITAGSAGQRILLVNAGTADIVLENEEATSAAANRFACPGAVDFTLGTGDSLYIWYDDGNNRWRVIGV